MPAKHCSQLNKVCFNSATNTCLRHPIECSELSRKQLLADVKSCLSCMGSRSREEVAMSSPVVLITGALTGIGRATAVAFAREGPRIVVSGRHHDQGQNLATQLRNLGTEAEFV